MESTTTHLPLLNETRNTSSRIPLPPYPRGWFVLEKSANLARNEVRPLRYFGKELVLFRGSDGSPSLLDAYCPHLGAHLGHGGCVQENTLQCPFHGWTFDSTGRCVAIPYAQKIPPTAKVRAWPIREVSGILFVFYDPEGIDPPAGWDPPNVPELDDAAWISEHVLDQKVRTHVQEITENLADVAHLRTLHDLEPGTMVAEAKSQILHVRTPVKSDGARIGMPGFELPFVFGVQIHGLGLSVVRIEETLFESLLFTAGTPIDGESVHLRLAIMTRKLPSEEATDMMHKTLVTETIANMGKEVRLMEHKVYQARPILCEMEGPLPIFRRWAKQFFEAAVPAAED